MSYYRHAPDAMSAPMEPKTPCRQFSTRPCVDLSVEDYQTFKVELCAPGECTRFPNLDKEKRWTG